jgi:hypothetical protein
VRGKGAEESFLSEGCRVMRETYARSTPAENTFSTAEDRTTTRTVESSAILSKAAPYSRQNLFRIVHVKGKSVSDRSPAPITYCSLNAFTGGLMENGGRGEFDLSYTAVR